MVIVLLAHAAVTPAGNPVAVPIPVAPVVVWVMAGLSALLIHKVLAALLVTVLFGVTMIVPVAFTTPQPPVNGIVYANVPAAVGVPLNVITLAAQLTVTPAGKPVAVPIPVAPVVACVLLIVVPIHKVVFATVAAVFIFTMI